MTSFMRCVKCVMPNTRPDTAFVDGVCSACLSYERRPTIDWKERRAQLLALLARHDGRCIVPSSGGKDSTYQALTLIELGAKPIIVTATTCMLTDIGRRNIDNLARYAPTIEFTPNREVRAKLNRLGLEMVGDISWPEHASIFSVPFRAALQFKTPLIFYGENPQDAYGGPLGADDAKQMTLRWRNEFGGFLGLRPSDFVDVNGITEDDMKWYQPPSPEQLESMEVEAHFLGQYLPWDSFQNAQYSVDHGFEYEAPYPGNYLEVENQDNAQTGVHDFFGFLKYGYGRGCAQVSMAIRAGRMTREQGMRWVAEFDGLFPVNYMGVHVNKVLRRVQMSSDEFLQQCNNFVNRDLFVEDEVRWGRRPTLKEFA